MFCNSELKTPWVKGVIANYGENSHGYTKAYRDYFSRNCERGKEFTRKFVLLPQVRMRVDIALVDMEDGVPVGASSVEYGLFSSKNEDQEFLVMAWCLNNSEDLVSSNINSMIPIK